MGLLCADWQRVDYVVFSSVVYLRHGVLRQGAVLQQPFFVQRRQDRTQKPHDALFVGEDANHLDGLDP